MLSTTPKGKSPGLPRPRKTLTHTETQLELNKAERIDALLAAKDKLDEGKAEALYLSVSGIAEHQWVLDALALLLELERERGPTPLLWKGQKKGPERGRE